MGKSDKRTPRPQGKVITDPRFAKVHTDARFQIFPNKQRKVEIDERFKGMLTEERFQHTAPVDKRGRKVKTERKNEDLQKFYRLGDQEEHEERRPDSQAEQPALAKKKKKKQGAQVEMVERPAAMDRQVPSEAEEHEKRSSEEEESDVDAEADLRWKRMRGLVGPETSSDEEQSDSEAMSDSEFDADDIAEVDDEAAQWGEDGTAAASLEQIPAGEDSKRLALVNMDWDRIRAVDLLVVLRSFLAKGQRIERVTVYPTVFGQERIAEEAVMGPQIADPKVQHLSHGSTAEAEDGTDGQSDSDADSDSAPAEAKGSRGVEDTGAEVDREALHEYERGRQRYYFALVECDSIATGAHLYKECDELEFELTGNKLDVRFVADELSFEDRQVRDSATDVPADYEPPPFFTASTAHTNPKLTWDADDDVRRRKLSKRVTADQLREDDFKAYLASGSEDEGEDEEEDEEEVERKRKLLLEDTGAQQPLHRKGGKDWGAAANGHTSADEDDQDGGDVDGEEEKGAGASMKRGTRRGDVDMEVTFAAGLESLEQRMAAKRDSKAAKTVWEKNEQRIREKKMAAKQKGRRYASSDEEGDGTISEDDLPANAQDDPFFQHDDSAFDDPFFQGGNEEPDKPLKEAERAAKREKKRKENAERLAAENARETEEQRGKAELELLLLDEHALRDQAVLGGKAAASERGPTGKPQKMSRKERVKLKKAQKRQERAAGSDDDDLGTGGPAFKANLEDPRFASIFKDPNFALDPTDPRFIHTAGTAELATAVAKRKKRKVGPEGDVAPVAAIAPLPAANDGQPNSAAELRAMVFSLKKKTAAKSSKRARA